MPIHLPFHLPRIPDFLKRPLDPSQTLEAFEHYAEKAIDFATRHGGEIGRNIMDDLVDAAAPYAAFLDTTVDAFLPGINLYYGEKWASRQGRKNPFKQKGGVVKPTPSQSSAQRMPKRGRDDVDDILRDIARKRRLTREQAGNFGMRGNISLAKRGRLTKKRKPKAKFLGVTRNYDDHGTVSRNFAAYFVAQSHGSHDRIFDIVGEAVAKRCLADLKIYPASYDQPLDVNTDSNQYHPMLKITYRRVADNGTVSDTEPVGIDTWNAPGVGQPESAFTFREFAAALATQIQDFADSPGTTGAVPFSYKWVNISSTGVESVSTYENTIRSLATAKINISCKQIIKLQNVTPNDSGGLDTAQADRNPISGKCYTAGDHIPRVREPLLTVGVHPEYNDFRRTLRKVFGAVPI